MTTAGVSFTVYSVIIGSESERSCLYVIMELDPELSYLGYWGTTTVASSAVYSIIVGSDPERSRLSIIITLEPELLCLGSWDVDSCLPSRFVKLEPGLLWRGLKGIVSGGGDVRSYVGIDVTLD